MSLPLRSAAFALSVLAALSACRKNEPASTDNPARWSVSSVSGPVQPGSIDTVRFAAVLDSGWYIYSLTQKAGGPTPMSVKVAPSPPFSIEGTAIGPQPVVIFDKEFGIETERYEGNPSFAVPVAVAAPADAQPKTLDIKVRYQACNASFCLPARTTVLTTRVGVAGRT